MCGAFRNVNGSNSHAAHNYPTIEIGPQVMRNAGESKQTHAAETIYATINKNLKNTKQQKTMKSNGHNGRFLSTAGPFDPRWKQSSGLHFIYLSICPSFIIFQPCFVVSFCFDTILTVTRPENVKIKLALYATRASTTSLLCVGASMLCVCVCMSILGNGRRVPHSLCKRQNGQTNGRRPPYGPAATLTRSDVAHIPNPRDDNTRRDTRASPKMDAFVRRNGSFPRMSEKEAEGREQTSAEGNRWTENMRGKKRDCSSVTHERRLFHHRGLKILHNVSF